MEVAGGVISLAWDVFDSAVRIFKFITALVDMPQEFEQRRLQLIMEYNRVLAWGKAAGLVDTEGTNLGAALGTDSIELVAIVARIQWLLSEFRELNARYGNELPVAIREGETGDEKQPTDMDVLKEISSLAMSYEAKKKERRHARGTNHIREFFERTGHQTLDIVTHPVRVRWIALDKDTFDGLLKDIHTLTERLHELMRNYREREIDNITAKTYREMILTRNNVEQLRDMLDAVTSLISTSAGTRREGEAHLNDHNLQDLVQLKKLSRISDAILAKLHADHSRGNTKRSDNIYQRLSDLDVTVRRYTDADLSRVFEWNEQDSDEPELLTRPRGILNTEEGHVPVWIEWKAIGDIPPGSLRDEESALRTMALAEMLHQPKPASLHAPECVGFFDDREVSGMDRYGWMFKMPDDGDYDTRVASLYDVLGDVRKKPPLSQRVAMAAKLCATVLNLHAVNWLHKGIFSDNVIFHFSGDDGNSNQEDGQQLSTGNGATNSRHNPLGYDPSKPLLSGFEFSRPDGTETTARDVDIVWDLYRWPGIQRQRPTERNSRKTYDLYSLGLVLLEIAHWEKLHVLMHLGGGRTDGNSNEEAAPNIPLEQSKSVRDWLLGLRCEVEAPFVAAGRPNPLEELRNIVGDRYWAVVERCLWAHGEKGFGVDELANQTSDSDVGVRLQAAFEENVVDILAGVIV
ncbi:prion-inhibition and propagation-domain-containing protein [Dichotomopilus funicola]|uniref:Prion-inhibition and propagation-domain-containing protein n=1 Tax=Dichotomopilus funicola TaxID=1934379 RepID=A0AAN6ZSI8_9PEZI|nr:prion-inhibition and propagation-domain-containing protein [Dichotomopilus funicola]